MKKERVEVRITEAVTETGMLVRLMRRASVGSSLINVISSVPIGNGRNHTKLTDHWEHEDDIKVIDEQ